MSSNLIGSAFEILTEFNISSNSFSFEKMKEEADKCILLCSNCHKEEHYK